MPRNCDNCDAEMEIVLHTGQGPQAEALYRCPVCGAEKQVCEEFEETLERVIGGAD